MARALTTAQVERRRAILEALSQTSMSAVTLRLYLCHLHHIYVTVGTVRRDLLAMISVYPDRRRYYGGWEWRKKEGY